VNSICAGTWIRISISGDDEAKRKTKEREGERERERANDRGLRQLMENSPNELARFRVLTNQLRIELAMLNVSFHTLSWKFLRASVRWLIVLTSILISFVSLLVKFFNELRRKQLAVIDSSFAASNLDIFRACEIFSHFPIFASSEQRERGG